MSRTKVPSTPQNSASDLYSSLSPDVNRDSDQQDSESENIVREMAALKSKHRKSSVADAMIVMFDKQMEIRRKSEVCHELEIRG